MLEQITPLLLTYNELPNIERTLARLEWAADIVVVDSFSTDGTAELLADYPRVRLFQRRFDRHADQWNYGLQQTAIKTPWVMALDADYWLSDGLIEELRELSTEDTVCGWECGFRYCVDGHPLRASLYPPVTVLYRADRAHYRQDGHTQRVVVDGEVRRLQAPIFHDDRKPLAHWLQAQDRYMRIEAAGISQSSWGELGWPDRLRKTVLLAPPVVFIYCLLVRGLVLDGRHGLFYAMQRLLAELLLSLHLLQRDLGVDGG